MLLKDIKINENLFNFVSPSQIPAIHNGGGEKSFNKMEEIKKLKISLHKHINEYFHNIHKDPTNKEQYFQELGGELSNELEIIISKLRQYLTDQLELQPITEEIEDKSLVRNLNKLFNHLSYIHENTSLIHVEKILILIYKKLKEVLNINFPVDVDQDIDVNIDTQDEAYDFYLKKFYKNPTTNFEELAKTDETNSSMVAYIQALKSHEDEFKKEWEAKYKHQAYDDRTLDQTVEDEFSNVWAKKPMNDKRDYQTFKKDWLKKYAYDRYFQLWFNGVLNVKFNELWDKDFKFKWFELFKKERAQHEDKLKHLKEGFNKLFRGENA